MLFYFNWKLCKKNYFRNYEYIWNVEYSTIKKSPCIIHVIVKKKLKHGSYYMFEINMVYKYTFRYILKFYIHLLISICYVLKL